MRLLFALAVAASVAACGASEGASSTGGSSSSSSSSGGGGDGGGALPGDAGGDAGTPPVTTYARKSLAFDELPGGTEIAKQYAQWVTFSTDPGCALSTSSSAGVASSQPNYLWTYYSCPTGPSASIFLDFAKPTKNVSFTLVGVNGSQKVATARIVKKDGTKVSTDIIGKGSYTVPVVVSVAEADVIRVEIVDVNDAYGLGFDDLSFDFPNP